MTANEMPGRPPAKLYFHRGLLDPEADGAGAAALALKPTQNA